MAGNGGRQDTCCGILSASSRTHAEAHGTALRGNPSKSIAKQKKASIRRRRHLILHKFDWGPSVSHSRLFDCRPYVSLAQHHHFDSRPVHESLFVRLNNLSCRLRCSLRLKARLQYWHLYFFSGCDAAFFGVFVVAVAAPSASSAAVASEWAMARVN